MGAGRVAVDEVMDLEISRLRGFFRLIPNARLRLPSGASGSGAVPPTATKDEDNEGSPPVKDDPLGRLKHEDEEEELPAMSAIRTTGGSSS